MYHFFHKNLKCKFIPLDKKFQYNKHKLIVFQVESDTFNIAKAQNFKIVNKTCRYITITQTHTPYFQTFIQSKGNDAFDFFLFK